MHPAVHVFEPDSGGDYSNPPHPPLTSILGHIEQFGPTLHTNKDVIAAVEAGFLGPWGEWHSAPLADTPSSRLAVKNKLLASFPGIILFRYPRHIREWYGESITGATGGPAEARRIGMHNDSILSLRMDNGNTWRTNDFDASSPTADSDDDRLYIRRLVWFNSYGGEVAPDDTYPDTYLAGLSDPVDHANKDFFFNHVQYLNVEGGHDEVKAILDARDPTFYPAWARRIGYRYRFTSVVHDSWTVNGGSFTITLTLRNEGVARIMYPRPFHVRLIPRFSGAPIKEYLVPGIQPWDWVPTYDNLPDHSTGPHLIWLGEIAYGEYDVGIRMPDSNALIAGDSRYCVRPANENVAATGSSSFQGWDATTGTFMLGTRVRIW